MKIFKVRSENKEKLSLLKSYLGDLKNIENINHCSTRIRVKVLDIKKVDLEKIKQIDFINNAIINENIVHLLISKDIENINKELLNSLGIDISKVTNLFDVKITEKKKFMQIIFDGISLIIGPLIPFLITLALVSTLSNVIGIINKDSVVYEMFQVLQNGLVLGFSIIIPWSIFKMMGGREAIGLAIGIVLCSRDLFTTQDFLSGNDSLFTWTEFKGNSLSFSDLASGYPWRISYEGQILPIVAIAFLGVYLERLINKIKIGVIHQLLGIPLVTIIAFFVGILVLAPIGMLITYGLNVGFLWATTNEIAKYIFNPLFGLLLPWMVVTGIIQVFVVMNIQQFTVYGATTIMPMFTQLNIAVATSVLAFSIMNRKNKELQKNAVPAYLIAFIGGSTEPALFGVSLRFIFPVIAASIGTALGIIITTASGVVATMGNASLLIFLSVIPNANTIKNFNLSTWAGTGFLWMAIAIIVTFVSTFLLTIIFSKVAKYKNLTEEILNKDFTNIVNKF